MKMRMMNGMLFGILFLFGLLGVRSVWAELPSAGNVVLWLKADTGVQKDANNSVNGWQDQSGKSNNAVQTNTAFQPLWVAAAVDGKPAVRFTGTRGGPATSVEIADNPSLNPAVISIFVYGKLNTVPYEGILINKEGQYRILASDADGTHQSARFSTATVGWGDGVAIGSVALSSGTMYLFESIYDGSNWQLYLNGAADGSKAVGGDLNSNLGSAMDLGSGYPGSWGMNADISEVIIYNKALTDTERQSVESYLNSKYGITTSRK